MKTPAFWRRRFSPASLALWPLSLLYGWITAWRMARPGSTPPLPVVCVGNFVAGGAGKTPTVIALARLVRDHGLEPVLLTRGHGGAEAGPLRVDPAVHGVADVGDEALLLARAAPTIVARDRAAALPLLAASGADIILMDDGFQNPAIVKTLSLVVVDGPAGAGNGRVIPAGPLRAPLGRQVPRADAIVVHGDPAGSVPVIRRAARAGKPVFEARLVAGTPLPPGRPLVAFAGIGRPDKFFGQLSADGGFVAATHAFADHHVFSDAEARMLLADCDRLGALPVTTGKDAVRLAGFGDARAALAARMIVYEVDLRFAAPDALWLLIDGARARWKAARY